ncbi:hypothetical protein GBA52_008127 [Prunus armeniaca]|nr:hypothetical protein GBA52_008127 [Prunus armeniaca]
MPNIVGKSASVMSILILVPEARMTLVKEGEVGEAAILLQICENSVATSPCNTSPELDIENLKVLKVLGKGVMAPTLLLATCSRCACWNALRFMNTLFRSKTGLKA